MAANKTIGGINVTITATTDKFAKGIANARKQMSTFEKQVKASTLGLKSFAGALVGAVSAGAMANFTKQGIEQISTLVDLSDKLGVSTEKLGGLLIAAEDSSVSASTFERSMLKLVKSTRDASMGLGTTAKAYERLGLNVDTLSKMRPDEQLLSVVDAMGLLTDENEKLGLTLDLFGTKGSDMVRLLDQGRLGLQKFQEQAKLTGMAIKDDVARQVEGAGDSIAKFERVYESFKLKAAILATPAINAGDEALTGILLNQGDFGKHVKRTLLDVYNPLGWLMREGARGAGNAGRVGLREGIRAPGYVGGTFKNHGDGSALQRTPPEVYEAARRAEFLKGFNDLFGDAIQKATMGMGIAKDRGPGLLNEFNRFRQNALGNAVEGFFNLEGPGNKLEKERMRRASQRPALTFAESGSVESYRQQAAIRRQSENIAKRQLNVQEKMLGELQAQNRNAIVLAPANLGRG